MQKFAKDAVYDLLDDAKSDLVSSLTLQGQARTLRQLAKERIATVTGPYYVSIEITEFSLWEDTGTAQIMPASEGELRAQYEVELEVFDYAKPKAGDTQQFEGAGEDFDLLCDRIVKTLQQAGQDRTGRQRGQFPDSTNAHWFQLNPNPQARQNRRVIVSNRDTVVDDEGERLFYSVIRFSLLQEVVDLSAI